MATENPSAATSSAEPASPRRRWLQFSLRSLMLLVSLSALASWLGITLRGHYLAGQREKEAIAWVEANRGTVEYYAYSAPANWRHRCFPAWYPPAVEAVVLNYDPNAGKAAIRHDIGPLGRRPGPKDLSPLAELHHLRELRLIYMKLPSLAPLLRLQHLEELSLARSDVDDLRVICRLTSLRSLNLYETDIKDISALGELHALEELSLGWTAVHDIAPLRELKKLREVGLSLTRVTDFSPLYDLPHLEHVSLDKKPLGTAEDVAAFELALPANAVVEYTFFF